MGDELRESQSPALRTIIGSLLIALVFDLPRGRVIVQHDGLFSALTPHSSMSRSKGAGHTHRKECVDVSVSQYQGYNPAA